jgi:hypothetical protein
MASRDAVVAGRSQGADGAVLDDEDEYYEYNDDRPNLEPVDRPTDERGERPMRGPSGNPRWGPNRRNSR